jgi:hypothetical protein
VLITLVDNRTDRGNHNSERPRPPNKKPYPPDDARIDTLTDSDQVVFKPKCAETPQPCRQLTGMPAGRGDEESVPLRGCGRVLTGMLYEHGCGIQERRNSFSNAGC